MYHVQRFSTVRSIYYAFYKWKAHHIVEHNYWISVTSRLFNRVKVFYDIVILIYFI